MQKSDNRIIKIRTKRTQRTRRSDGEGEGGAPHLSKDLHGPRARKRLKENLKQQRIQPLLDGWEQEE